MAVIQLQVQTYSGYQADERPTSFVLGGRTFQVEDIIDQWYGEDHAYFKLMADDGNLYIIRHDNALDLWELTMTETLKK
ncbi:MAG TPA: hypothetical protein VGJ93_12420 [Desulfuromonadaceae bacterium]|jgi:hypothetical protein